MGSYLLEQVIGVMESMLDQLRKFTKAILAVY